MGGVDEIGSRMHYYNNMFVEKQRRYNSSPEQISNYGHWLNLTIINVDS